MAKMRVVAPKLEKIKQQYGDDRERLNKAMMELYKTEKINPLGGCLPMLIQIPVFIALYWAILSSVELRHAPFFGWITDLSAADPYYILPLIMGVSMMIQSKLNPVPPDPMQAKVMQIMPIVFSVVFFFFPAGLVLYSVVNNMLSIAQQWYITRAPEAAPKVLPKPDNIAAIATAPGRGGIGVVRVSGRGLARNGRRTDSGKLPPRQATLHSLSGC